MKITTCSICKNDNVPYREAIKVEGKIYCKTCFESHFPEKKLLQGKRLERLFDPTICTSCGKDFGNTILQKISNYPVCDDCISKIEKRTFPAWVKLFFLAFACIVIFSFIWNWRFYQAYSSLKKANIALVNNDYPDAARLMLKASQKVSEVKEIGSLAAYFNGLALLSEDKSGEALVEFHKCKDHLPTDFNIRPAELQAEMGAGYEKKDYNLFLASAKEFLMLDTTVAMSWASVSSAYACLYVANSLDSNKTIALNYLEKARSINDSTKEIKDYFNRIECRLYTKEILNKEEFDKKYPNGWTKN